MQTIYQSEVYAELNPSWHEEDSPWKARQIETILRKNAIAFDRACEVGCGTGEILFNLAKAFPAARFHGYEISPHAYQRAKYKETDAVTFSLGDFTAEGASDYDLLVIAAGGPAGAFGAILPPWYGKKSLAVTAPIVTAEGDTP